MKSSKWMIGLVAVVLVLALAPSSFAQIQVQLFNTPSSAEIATNHHANTADVSSPGAGLLISGQLIAASSLTTTSLVLTFPGPITSSPVALDGTIAGSLVLPIAPSTNDGIRIEGATGLFAAVTAVASVNYAGGTITVTLPGFPPPAGNSISGSFRITGIRMDVNGKAAPLSLTSAALSSSANNYIGPSSLPTLISAVGAGLASFTQGTIAGATDNGTALMFANAPGAPADALASIKLSEGFAAAWRSASQTATTGVGADISNGSNIKLTIAGLPAGITATLSQVFVGNPATYPGIALTNAGAMTSATTTSNTTTISFTGAPAPDLTAVENLAFDVVLTGVPSGTLPLASAPMTLTATMAPASSTGGTSLTNGYPRFTQADLGPVTIGSVASATTTMLIPFSARVGSLYDTGIAIANTTLDPFTGAGGATAGSGNMTFNLFPRLISGTAGGPGTQTTIATSAIVRPGANGGGLDANGNLLAGGTWAATLSELMTAGSVTGDFIGYIFIQANFIDAHGISYIIENGHIAGTVPILVLKPPLATSRNVVDVETLGF